MQDTAVQLDTSIEIVTPENIAFRYRVAGPFRRLGAYLIDVLIQVVVCFVGSLVFALVFGFAGLANTGMGLTLALWFLLTWFYGGIFETVFNGQTPGKRLLQLRVVSVEGQPINATQAVLRNLLRVVDGQPGWNFFAGPFTYQLGLLTATMNDRFQRLGDLAAGTMVVVEERQWFQGVMSVNDPEALRAVEPIPANFQVSRTLGRALAAYVQRRQGFSRPRRLEIARHLGEPLRAKFNLPPDTNLDLLLCGLYQRTFITGGQGKRPGEDAASMESQIPFAESLTVQAMAQRATAAERNR